MTRINLCAKIFVLVIVIIFNAIPECSSVLPDKRLCYDPKCSEPISMARTILAYRPGERGMLSLPTNTVVTVYSKGAGKRTDLWEVEFKGQRGYVPVKFLREYKILRKTLTHEVPTEEIVNSNNDNKENKNNNVNDNVSNLEGISLNNEESKPDSIPQYSSPSNTNIDASVPTTDGTSMKHLTSETENISELFDIIDGTTIFKNNEVSTQSNYDSVVKMTDFPHSEHVKSNSYTSIKPTATQMELGTNTKHNKLHQETDSEKSKVTNDGSISHTMHIKSDKIIGESQLMTKNNVNSSTVEPEVKQEKSSEDFSIPGLVHEEKESNKNPATSRKEDKNSTIALKNEKEKNIDSSNFESSNNKEKDDADSFILGIGNKEQIATLYANKKTENSNDKDNVDSFLTEMKENDKKERDLESLIPALGQDKEKSNILSSTAESEHKKETEILNITIKHTSNMNNLLLKPESQKQVELESEEKYKNDVYISTINDDSNNTMSEEKHVISESQQIDESKDLLNVAKSVEIIGNDKQEVQQFAINNNVLNKIPQKNVCDHNPFKKDEVCDIVSVQKEIQITLKENNQMKMQDSQMNIVNSDVQNDNMNDVSNSVDVPMESKTVFEDSNEKLHSKNDEQLQSSQNEVFHEFRGNRNLLYLEEKVVPGEVESEVKNAQNGIDNVKTETLPGYENIIGTKDKVLPEIEDKDTIKEDVFYNRDVNDATQLEETALHTTVNNMIFSDVCSADNDCANDGDDVNYGFTSQQEKEIVPEGSIMKMIKVEHSYWVTLLYLSITAITTLIFSLGYYYIENMRRDSQLIAKINKLEKELLLSTKECLTLDENLKVTKEKLNCIQDESFGSNEMVLSLKADLEASQNAKAELEDQVTMLEKDLESATEAGLELERMLREVLSSNNEVNPLAQSVEDLQARLDAQQSANESLTNALNIKTQENEALSVELAAIKKKYEEVGKELACVTENFQVELNKKNKIQEDLNNIVQQLEVKIKQLTMDKTNLCKELKIKETEVKDLVEVINQINSNNLDIGKLYEISHIKAEASQLLEERDELKIRLSEVEGAHNLLEEHMKVVKEEVSALSEQCKLAEKEKRDAETRLEVISNFFKEKEAQRQKEEALWLQKQGEVMSTVERIHTMQNEIQGYKQQIEVLKREIVDQEREYKSHISALETKAHEQWVMARQNERRLEESKAEAGQLRNRLTLIEKNLSDADADTKLHRLDANGETATSPPLFIGAESSSSPIMFTGSSGVPPPPPPSFMHPSLFPTYLPPPLPSASGLPPYDVGQRPPPLGGRLSSPPPMPLHPPPSGRYENADSPPPLMSPPLLPPFNHRSHPPPFASDHMHHHPPPPPPPGSILLPPLGTSHSWGEETLPPPRNSGYHPHQREQRARNHKGSLHSSGESLDKSHHSGKV